LSYLVTKEKGYGTKMIARVVRNALKENKNGIILESLASAKKFYEKIGMQRVEDYSDLYMFDKKGMKEFINKFDKKEK
jgi:histone acetyltransferase (RNA polymerase elongator complex component)